MLRLIHIFDLKPGVDEEAFLSWVDSTLFEKAKEFGCIERKNWIFLDGLDDPYSKEKIIKKRPRYINEAFWSNAKGAEDFRQWLLSMEGLDYRNIWNESTTNHSVLRYVDYAPPQSMGDD